MVECDHHPTYRDITTTGSFESIDEKIIQDELTWGLSYRHLKKKEKEVPIPLKKSPMDIPFKICREKQRQKKIKKKAAKKKEPKVEEKKPKTAKKLTLLERSVLSQNKYMEYLSIPNIRKPQKETVKKPKCRCYIEPCPPRVVQLAVPNKRKVFARWQDYYTFLPTDMIMRYEKILHTDKNLEPREARYYYKKLDKQKKKRLMVKRNLLRKKKAEKVKGDQAWLNEQITSTTKVIMDYIIEEPLFSLTYKQLMLSNGILDRLDEVKLLKKPKRSTKSQFKRFIIEFSDKIAVWMDTLTRFVDIQAIDDDEDIAPLTISSLGEEEEEESEESSYYSELEEEMWGEFVEGEAEAEGGEFRISLALMEELLLAAEEEEGEAEGEVEVEGEAEAEAEGIFEGMDLDLLEKLISILCSDEHLDGEVNSERMPGVRYTGW